MKQVPAPGARQLDSGWGGLRIRHRGATWPLPAPARPARRGEVAGQGLSAHTSPGASSHVPPSAWLPGPVTPSAHTHVPCCHSNLHMCSHRHKGGPEPRLAQRLTGKATRAHPGPWSTTRVLAHGDADTSRLTRHTDCVQETHGARETAHAGPPPCCRRTCYHVFRAIQPARLSCHLCFVRDSVARCTAHGHMLSGLVSQLNGLWGPLRTRHFRALLRLSQGAAGEGGASGKKL